MSNLTLAEYFIAIVPLLIGLIAARLLPIKLKAFQAVYLGLIAASLVLTYLFLPSVSILWIIIGGIAGLLAVVLLAGFSANKFTSTNYSSILVAIGLFPWYVGTIPTAMYVLASILFLGIHTWIRAQIAFKSMGLKFQRFETIKKKLSKEDFAKFSSKAGIVFALPIIAGALTTALFV